MLNKIELYFFNHNFSQRIVKFEYKVPSKTRQPRKLRKQLVIAKNSTQNNKNYLFYYFLNNLCFVRIKSVKINFVLLD